MPTIAELIREHALTTSTPELFALIRLHHPNASIPVIVNELRVVGKESMEHADELDAYRPPGPANDP